MVRTLACHARGRRFEPVPGRQFFASVAQSVEQGTENPRVDGSIPSGGTKNADVAHLVERHLAKVEVASSSLVGRSILWKFSSAGRASALQAEGHRFEPYRSHYGWIPEWPKGTDCKSAANCFGGSNPPPPI